MKRIACMAGLAGALLAALPGIAAAAPAGPQMIAGLTPYGRPMNAPAIKEFTRTPDWQARALEGVSQPVPESISRFLAAQGAWYNPFLRPGMPGRYDVRGMHVGHKAATP